MNTISILTAAALLAVPTFAQGPKGPNPSAPATGQPTVNISAATTISGRITAVQIAYGTQYPSIALDGKTVKVAPVWFLLDNDLELAAGDEVSVFAAPSTREGDPSFFAISLAKLSSGVTLVMRSERGTPLWTAQGNGNSSAQRRQSSGAGCVDPASIVEAKGVVDAVTQGAGIQQPQLTLVADGKLITVKIGPERVLLAADMELKAGMTLTVRYATASCTGELVALSLTDETGKTLALRNDSGAPAWN